MARRIIPNPEHRSWLISKHEHMFSVGSLRPCHLNEIDEQNTENSLWGGDHVTKRCVHMHTAGNSCTRARTCTRSRTHADTHTHTHTRTYTHTHTGPIWLEQLLGRTLLLFAQKHTKNRAARAARAREGFFLCI